MALENRYAADGQKFDEYYYYSVRRKSVIWLRVIWPTIGPNLWPFSSWIMANGRHMFVITTERHLRARFDWKIVFYSLVISVIIFIRTFMAFTGCFLP